MHLKNKHPDVSHADGLVLKCSKCSFKTVSTQIYETHISKHENLNRANAYEESHAEQSGQQNSN